MKTKNTSKPNYRDQWVWILVDSNGYMLYDEGYFDSEEEADKYIENMSLPPDKLGTITPYCVERGLAEE